VPRLYTRPLPPTSMFFSSGRRSSPSPSFRAFSSSPAGRPGCLSQPWITGALCY